MLDLVYAGMRDTRGHRLGGVDRPRGAPEVGLLLVPLGRGDSAALLGAVPLPLVPLYDPDQVPLHALDAPRRGVVDVSLELLEEGVLEVQGKFVETIDDVGGHEGGLALKAGGDLKARVCSA